MPQSYLTQGFLADGFSWHLASAFLDCLVDFQTERKLSGKGCMCLLQDAAKTGIWAGHRQHLLQTGAGKSTGRGGGMRSPPGRCQGRVGTTDGTQPVQVIEKRQAGCRRREGGVLRKCGTVQGPRRPQIFATRSIGLATYVSGGEACDLLKSETGHVIYLPTSVAEADTYRPFVG